MSYDKEYIKSLENTLKAYEEVEVVFTTKKGKERVMRCSSASTMPSEGRDNFALHHESIIAVYDLDYSAWRSFRKDSVLDFRVIK